MQARLGCEWRPAGTQDHEAICTLIFSILRSYGLPPDPDATDADLADIERHYLSRQGYFEVACTLDTKAVIGTWGIYKIDDKTCELRKMYLDPSFRGQGIGQRMLERALAKAKELGYRVVTLETASVLKEAIALYEKYGFRRSQSALHVARCDQAYELEI